MAWHGMPSRAVPFLGLGRPRAYLPCAGSPACAPKGCNKVDFRKCAMFSSSGLGATSFPLWLGSISGCRSAVRPAFAGIAMWAPWRQLSSIVRVLGDTGCSGAACAPVSAGLLHAAFHTSRGLSCSGSMQPCLLENLRSTSFKLATLDRLPPCAAAAVVVGRKVQSLIHSKV